MHCAGEHLSEVTASLVSTSLRMNLTGSVISHPSEAQEFLKYTCTDAMKPRNQHH
jgi:hypothetical protein